jgi:hypothetical protein
MRHHSERVFLSLAVWKSHPLERTRMSCRHGSCLWNSRACFS